MLQVISSVVAATFGVQNCKNRKRDFEQNRMQPYIIGGIVFIALFVGAVHLVVSTVLRCSAVQSSQSLLLADPEHRRHDKYRDQN